MRHVLKTVMSKVIARTPEPAAYSKLSDALNFAEGFLVTTKANVCRFRLHLRVACESQWRHKYRSSQRNIGLPSGMNGRMPTAIWARLWLISGVAWPTPDGRHIGPDSGSGSAKA